MRHILNNAGRLSEACQKRIAAAPEPLKLLDLPKLLEPLRLPELQPSRLSKLSKLPKLPELPKLSKPPGKGAA